MVDITFEDQLLFVMRELVKEVRGLHESVDSAAEELKKVAVELYMRERDPGGGPG